MITAVIVIGSQDRFRVYWVGLLKVIKLACKYINKHEAKLPEDLPPVVRDAFPYIRAACLALEAYDKLQRRGPN